MKKLSGKDKKYLDGQQKPKEDPFFTLDKKDPFKKPNDKFDAKEDKKQDKKDEVFGGQEAKKKDFFEKKDPFYEKKK